MCFTERQSYLHAIILFVTAFIYKEKWRLSYSLIFLGFKDLLQGLLYTYINDKQKLNLFTSLSWLHICFQPLFVNLIFSYFGKEDMSYWNKILLICLVFSLLSAFKLKEFSLGDHTPCEKADNKDDYCTNETTSYLGKYHIGYKFNLDTTDLNDKWYIILSFLPGLFSNSKLVPLIWTFFVLVINYIFRNVGTGEASAAWCYLSIIFGVPLTIFSEYVKNLNII